MPSNKIQGLLSKARRSMPSSSAISATGLFLKLRFASNRTSSSSVSCLVWGESEPNAEGGGPPPSDGEKLEGAARVIQEESPGKSGLRRAGLLRHYPRLLGPRGAFPWPEPGLAAADPARRALRRRGREGKVWSGLRAAGAHLPMDQPPPRSESRPRRVAAPPQVPAWSSRVQSGIFPVPRLCPRTICLQHANCFNLVSGPLRGSPRAAGAMDVVQEQLKRGREPDPAARPNQTLGDAESRSSQEALGRGPSHPFLPAQPLPSLPLKDGDFTLESEFGT